VDLTFVEGVAAVVSGVIVFCGSVWLLLSMVMGPRLAYFISASLTLGFLLIMGVVWSINPLGPIGKPPEWDAVAIGEEASEIDFGPASDYPDAPWVEPNQDDSVELSEAAELGTDSLDYLASEIAEKRVRSFTNAADAAANSDTVRFLQQGEDQYGAVTLEAVPGAEGGPVITIMKRDPGNPLGPPRTITAGTFLLFAAHLFGLSRAEKRARELADARGAR
jgi:hypothetical protein